MANSRIKKLLTYLRPHWRAMTLGVITLFIVNAIGAYIPRLIEDSIDSLRGALDIDQIWSFFLQIFLLASIMWVIRMVSRVAIFGIGRQVEFEIKQNIFEHLLTLHPTYFFKNTAGDLISRATSDVENIRRLLGFAILSVVNTIFAYSLTLPFMLSINVPLSLAALGIYPLMLLTVQLFSNRLRNEQKDVQERLSDLSQMIQEDMSGISLIKIYAQEENEYEAFDRHNRQLLDANLKLARTRNLLFPIIEGLVYVSLLILLIFGSNLIARGVISIGGFVALIIYVERLVFPTALLGFTITAYQRGEVSIDRVEAILNTEPEIQNDPEAIALSPETIQGKITATNLNYTYPGSEKPALNNVNFAIQPGETVAVVGPIGSGKSTLANVLPRLLDIPSWKVFIDDYDITKLHLNSLRGAIAYVPQDSFLFSAPVQDNIRYGNPLAAMTAIETAAKDAQIHEEIGNFPQKYETIVGERGITLSGGQRQRTALARALMLNAPILILDDALSSVDNQTATQILRNLSGHRDNKTVVFITHQMSAAAICDRILVMDAGTIVQSGTHGELVKVPGLYQFLWQQHQLEEILQ
ncbi:MAG: ABC transporter ATP-binding protein [Jaaginema sp. PMC 1079.18]|nr:ABC transporter ATP-binding protein [Jaaginema sp. PMC 1080.18]MEC4850051.1 ABC transporter ATP-binding protein [Jaaginema sp. PMC 1079.18]MEC4865151.1 ABC transporter ATP-binding protein [Jaaginema sp. PMC 1078.18]